LARPELQPLESRLLPTTAVMPLGASITGGYPESHGGYRIPLLNLLNAAGISINYVGSQTTYNPPSQPNLQHEGHFGFVISDIDGLVKGGLLQQYNPATILLYIGTNNVAINPNAPWIQTDYKPLLDDIFAAKPGVQVIVSPLFAEAGVDPLAMDNFNIGSRLFDAQQHVVGYAGGLAQLVTAEQQLGHAITFNDAMRSALTLDDLVDGTHPTDDGYQKMAASWYAAIQAVTPGQLTNVAPTGPTGLVATAVSGTEIDLSWTRNSLTESAFQVDASTTWDFSQGVTTLTAAAGSNHLAVTGLAPGTNYYFRVRATNSFGASPNSLAATAVTFSLGLTSTDIGNPGQAGNTSFDGATWTVLGGGSDIWSAPDQFQYAYQTITGNTTIIARVGSVQNTAYWAKAGLMFRDGTGSGAPNVVVEENPNLQVEMQWRDTAGADSNWNGAQLGDTVNAKWLQLARSGNTFSAYYAATAGIPTSTDWVLIGTHTLAMANPTAGLAVTAGNNSALCTATFTNVSFGTATGAPAAPSGLAATTSDSVMNLIWVSNSANQTGYKVERATNSTFTQNLTLLTTTAANVTSFTDATVAIHTSYYYRVRATNGSGDSPNSNTASAAAAGSPAAPSGLSATGGFGQVSLAWISNSTNQTGFKVERATDPGFTKNLTLVTTTAANVTSFADTTGAAGTTSYYRVRATNANGDSLNSNVASARPLPGGWSALDIGSPPLAGHTTFDGTAWTVQGNGNDISSAPDQFQYAYGSVSGDTTIVAQVTWMQNTGAWAKAGVMFRDGTGSGAPYVDVVTHPSLTVEMDWRNSAGAASNWTGSVVGDSVNLKWVKLARSGNTFSGYYATTSGTPTSSDWLLIGTDTLAMTAPTAGLAVCSNNVNALATATFTGVGLTLSNAPPAAPSNLTAVASGSQVSLSWQSNSTNQTGFKVERANDSGFTQGLTLLTTTAATVTTYTDTTVTVGNTYYYRVRATNSFGDSANSNTASATVSNTPAAPSNLTAVGGGQISLSWQSNSTNQTGFKVERANDSGFTQNLTLLTTTAANVTTYTDTTGSVGVTYFYRVRATNSFGDSPNSNTASASIYLPAGWTNADIGSPPLAGSTTFNGTTWTIQGNGQDIANPPDQFQYAYRPVSGDTTIIARVTALSNTGAWAKAGVMVRDGADPGADFVAVFMHPSLTVEMEWRNSAGAASNWIGSVVGDSVNLKWVKLARSGNTFSGYYATTSGTPGSSDWLLIGTDTLAMTAPTAGLAVCSNNFNALATATLTNVAVTGQWVQTTAADFNAGTNSGTQVTNASGGEVQLAAASLNGTFTSVVFGAALPANWGTATWTANVPANTTLTVQTRSGNSPSPDATWSAWTTVANGQTVSNPAGRYFQYRLILTSTSASQTPVLFDITFLWS
jgi:titin